MARFYAEAVSPGSRRSRTPEGYLLCRDIPLSRTGSQPYAAHEVDRDGTLGLSGTVEVERPASEVFSPAALASFEGKSVVSPHPPQFLDATNDLLYAKGHVQNVRRGSHPETGQDVMLGDIMVKDSTLIHMIEDGHRAEISCGYTYDLDRVEDEHSPAVRFVQRNIRGNHVAVVNSARAGESIRVLDAAPTEGEAKKEAEMPEETKSTPAVKEEPGLLSQFGSFLKDAGLRLVSATDAAPAKTIKTTDGESEAVERNKKVARESMRLRSRVEDDDEEMEEEEEGAEKPESEEEKEDKGKKGGKEKTFAGDAMTAKDANELRRAIDALTRVVAKASGVDDDEIVGHGRAADAEKCTCDGEGTCEHCKEKEGRDSDLIPVGTLPMDERPKNPITGADAALAHLRLIRPAIAKSGDRKAIDSYNKAVRTLKRGTDASGEDDYGAIINDREKPEEVRSAEARTMVRRSTGDSKDDKGKSAPSYEDQVKKFHRQNPADVKLQ